MSNFLSNFYQQLEHHQIQYCLLRGDGQQDADELPASSAVVPVVEVDMLVAKVDKHKMQLLLKQVGFVALPNWGHTPHEFYVAYDQAQDRWLKLDVVSAAAYGRPIRALRTDLAAGCLQRRQWVEGLYVAAPEDELVMLLLHCLLDKGYIKAAHRVRLKALLENVQNEPLLTSLLKQYCAPIGTSEQLAAYIEDEAWDKLLMFQHTIGRQLANRNPIGVQMRRLVGPILRKANSHLLFRRPRAISVAVLAPDGAGKSTVTEGLAHTFLFPVRSIYMGLYQKQSDGGSLLLRLGLAGRIVRQWQRYAAALAHLARRHLVVFDRYTYDALLAAPDATSARKRWRRWLLAHCCPAPDLVLLLDAPGDVLFARKGEHSAELLETQRQQYQALRQHIPNMVVIDATQGNQEVRKAATAHIWRSYLQKQSGKQVPPFALPVELAVGNKHTSSPLPR